MSLCPRISFVPVSTILSRALVLAFVLAANDVSAGVWQWGCMGALDNDQIAFNRDRLMIIAGKTQAGRLDDFARGGDFEGGVKSSSIVAAYQVDDVNSGLISPMAFTSESGGSKLTLTEVLSRETGHSGGLVANCRDETIDRFRKTYRVERDNMRPSTVRLICVEYQLSSKGGRNCE